MINLHIKHGLVSMTVQAHKDVLFYIYIRCSKSSSALDKTHLKEDTPKCFLAFFCVEMVQLSSVKILPNN